MKVAFGLLLPAMWTAACSAQPSSPPEPPKPQIPQTLRGCWELRKPPSEEFPDGLSETLTVAGDRIIIDAKGMHRRVGTIEKVERMTPRLIEELISAREDGQSVTLATLLELEPEGALLLREGDAGSYEFSRCSAATAAAQRFSLVIAGTSHQDDPRPAPCGPDRSCDDFLYRGKFYDARVIAGAELPEKFEARLKLHTPFISPTVAAMIVERQSDGSLLARRKAGFNGRNGIACFRQPEEWPVDWKPEQVIAVSYDKGELCVFDEAQIDPNAPKE